MEARDGVDSQYSDFCVSIVYCLLYLNYRGELTLNFESDGYDNIKSRFRWHMKLL